MLSTSYFLQQLLLAPPPYDGIIPNPNPQKIPGVSEPILTLLAYLKWGVLIVIIAAGFVGAAAIAGGKLLAHMGASKMGAGLLMGAVAGAVLYVGVYTLITSIVES